MTSAWLLLGTQMLCSVFAGVYNERLLKGDGAETRVGTNLQNAYMYLNSVLWNAVVLLAQVVRSRSQLAVSTPYSYSLRQCHARPPHA